MLRHRGILVLAFVFLVLATIFGQITPYRTAGILLNQRSAPAGDIGAPDERQHANYIRYVRENRSIPVLKPGSSDLYETYQSHQPPLYYFLMAPLGDPTDPGTGKAMRITSAILGAITVLGLYFFGRWATDDDAVGYGTALLAFLPGFVMLHGAISNDPLLFALITWCLAFLVHAMRTEWTWQRIGIVGVLAGLAVLTKSSALALAPVLLLGVFLGLRAKSLDTKKSLAVLGLPLVFALPLWIRNVGVYGDPLALRAFREAFTGTAQASMFIEGLGAYTYWADWVAWWTARSFVGAFGYMDIFLPNNLYLLFIALLFVGSCGWLLGRRQGAEPVPAAGKLLAATLFAVVLLLFVQFNSTYFQGQARYLYPAMAGIALCIGGGFARLHPKWGPVALALALLGLNAFVISELPREFARRIPAAASNP